MFEEYCGCRCPDLCCDVEVGLMDRTILKDSLWEGWEGVFVSRMMSSLTNCLYLCFSVVLVFKHCRVCSVVGFENCIVVVVLKN